ncbi:hypothetical protein ACFE04_007226 [Oxalis oulophora]
MNKNRVEDVYMDEEVILEKGGFVKSLLMNQYSNSSHHSSPSSSNSSHHGFIYQVQESDIHSSLINFKSAQNQQHLNGSLLNFGSSVWEADDHQNYGQQLNNPCVLEEFQIETSYGSNVSPTKEIHDGNSNNSWLFTDSTIVAASADHGQNDGNLHKRSLMGESIVQCAKKQRVTNISTSSTTTNTSSATNKKVKPKSPAPSKDPQSIAAKNRRERISERLKVLQELVPNGSKVDLVTMLEKAISYVKFLQLQVKVLATDEFWPVQGGKAPDISQVKEAIDAILSDKTCTTKQ